MNFNDWDAPGRPGFLRNFGQFIIDTDKKVPSIVLPDPRGSKHCPIGFKKQCIAGLPCQDGYERHCTYGMEFPCICIK